ncbi:MULTISPECIES: hypothetical protein [Aeromonas]|uniref:hypothetical protein n=1 Tax=Aeromonas TaxID=642 RepID=UPI0020B2DC49|nr:hypothetical protein [Aeromonas sp. FDAARGOS 1417]
MVIIKLGGQGQAERLGTVEEFLDGADYASLSSEEQSGSNIVPHTLVYDGIRWHVRAYCEKK